MPWGAAIGAVGSIAASSMASDKNGGAGTATNTKEPWLLAQPWIQSNMAQGQALQQSLADQPFSAEQLAAQRNIYGQSDYMRGLVPSLLNQLQGQQVGFDRSNPSSVGQKAWDWNLLGSANNGGLSQESVANPAALPVKPKAEEEAKFMDQGDMLSGGNMSSLSPNAIGGLLGTGKYGTWTYGMNVPKAGTQEARDMSAYFANGGSDPNNLYGKGGTAISLLNSPSVNGGY